MAANIVHDLFTVFISKTLPSAHFVYEREENGRAGAPRPPRRARRSRPTDSLFRNRAQDQIAQPIRMRDLLAISVKRFDGRIDAQVAVRTISILPTLVRSEEHTSELQSLTN